MISFVRVECSQAVELVDRFVCQEEQDGENDIDVSLPNASQ